MNNDETVSEREIIYYLVDLIEAWMNGILKKQGITWVELPPALKMAKEYLGTEPQK